LVPSGDQTGIIWEKPLRTSAGLVVRFVRSLPSAFITKMS
jgi:hypothetical protein